MAAPKELCILVNGEPRSVPSPSTVADLVLLLGMQSAQVAIERNKQIVRHPEYATTRLSDGDQLEIVTFFGGG